jgi:acetyltransferase-like isoleucine patch superfamily enzyme
MEVGKYTYGINKIKVIWENPAKLKIGNFCSFANNITVFLGGNHRVDWITTYPFGHINIQPFNKFNGVGHPKTNGDVIIGNDVWVGDNVTIMSGVKIGDGAVISANSHVVENVKPYSVVGGNPSKFYYFRFNEETIKKLLELKWWYLEDNIINEISPILCSGDYEKLFEICNNLIKK